MDGTADAGSGPSQEAAALEARLRSGTGWFYWIAGLSVLNSVLQFCGSNTAFVIGMGATQVVDGILLAISQKTAGNPATALRAGGLAFAVAAALAFVAFGILSRKGQRWALITGMVLYGLDAGICAAFQDWLSLAFHGWALWSLWGGLKAMNALRDLPVPGPAGPAA